MNEPARQPQAEHPAFTNARQAIELEEMERRRLLIDPEAAYYRRMWICLVLSPNIDVFEALLRGEPVDPSALDQHWLRKLQGRGIWPKT